MTDRRHWLLMSGQNLLRHNFLRFLLIGAFNTAFGYAVYLITLACGTDPGLALSIATVIGAFVNYFTTGRVVFRNGGIGKLPAFLAAYAVIYGLNLAALHGMMSLGVSAQWAQATLLPLMAAISFLIFKYLIFGKNSGRRSLAPYPADKAAGDKSGTGRPSSGL